MLRKLMKHELRATGRIMLPLYLLVLLAALAANFSATHLAQLDSPFLNALGGLLLFAFMLGIFGLCLMSLLLMIQRFRKNLLGDEGYLMFTLPVSVHSQVLSKLLCSALWFFLTGVVVFLSICLLSFGLYELITDVPQLMGDLLSSLSPANIELLRDGFIVLFELLLLMFCGCCAMCLQIYACMSIGHSFPRHKLAMSVAVFFGLDFLFTFLGSSALFSLDTSLFAPLAGWIDSIEPMAGMQLSLLLLIGLSLLHCLLFYGITVYFLSKRLNLE